MNGAMIQQWMDGCLASTLIRVLVWSKMKKKIYWVSILIGCCQETTSCKLTDFLSVSVRAYLPVLSCLFLFVCLPVCLSFVCPCVCLSCLICLYLLFAFCLSVCFVCLCLPICLSVFPFLSLFVCLFCLVLSLYLCISLSVCLLLTLFFTPKPKRYVHCGVFASDQTHFTIIFSLYKWNVSLLTSHSMLLDALSP